MLAWKSLHWIELLLKVQTHNCIASLKKLEKVKKIRIRTGYDK